MREPRIRLTVAAVGLLLAGLPCRAQLYSTDMPGLHGFYGGITGMGLTDTFNFGQSFPYIGAAWLQVAGNAAVTTGEPTNIGLAGRLEGVWGPLQVVSDVTLFRTSVPLAVSSAVLDGAGKVDLFIGIEACCDHSALVTDATLWICTGDPDLSIRFAAQDEMTWEPPAGALAFDVVRGDLGALRGSGGDFAVAVAECLADDSSGPPLFDFEAPQPGEGLWYLMRRVTGTGHGSYDSCSPAQLGSRDVEIAQSGLDCS